MKNFKLLISLICVFSLLSGCTKLKQQSLITSIDKELTTLNHLKATDVNDIEQICQVMEGLICYDKDNKVKPAGAQSWIVSEDNLTYTFNLRKNSKWSDNTPVTSGDYLYSWKENLINKKSCFPNILFPIKNAKEIYHSRRPIEDLGVRIIDDFTLSVELERPYSAFIYGFNNPSTFPLKKDFYEKVGADKYGTSKETVLSNGSYIISDVNFSSEIKYEKNLYYWDYDKIKNNDITCKIIKEENTNSILFEDNLLDFFKANVNLYEKYKNENKKIVSLNTNKITYLYFSTNNKDKFLQDKRVREAISKSIDRDHITKKVLDDGSEPLNRLVLNYKTNIEDKSYYDLFGVEKNFYTDLKTSKKLWQDVLDEKKIYNYKLDVHICAKNNNTKVFENIKQQLERNLPGLSVELKTIPASLYSQTLKKEPVVAAVQNWTSAFPNPESTLQIMDKDSYFNYAKYNDDNFQKSLHKAMHLVNEKEQLQEFLNAEKIVSDSYFVIPIYKNTDNYIVSKKISSISPKSTLPNIYYKDIF